MPGGGGGEVRLPHRKAGAETSAQLPLESPGCRATSVSWEEEDSIEEENELGLSSITERRKLRSQKGARLLPKPGAALEFHPVSHGLTPRLWTLADHWLR